jgi:hypothetical protein
MARRAQHSTPLNSSAAAAMVAGRPGPADDSCHLPPNAHDSAAALAKAHSRAYQDRPSPVRSHER